MIFPVYTDRHMFIEKDIKIAWQEIKTILVDNFEENLEDQLVYVNIHKLGLYKVSCTYPIFECRDMIHYIVSHAHLEMMILGSIGGIELSTLREEYYQ